MRKQKQKQDGHLKSCLITVRNTLWEAIERRIKQIIVRVALKKVAAKAGQTVLEPFKSS
ncbi:hypothetical protein O9992_19315 [Vibrio lentus]|nr:hypothetical protein [Vibrio lentus]